ncbi:T9SS type A sorting domain-containing protein [bacterium]|nr:T9SS type A sorting domain-containing protein [bacterium]
MQVAEGEGGGAGIGYKSDGMGLSGWLTLDGSEWFALHPSYGFAVEAILAERDEWSVLLEQANKALNQVVENSESLDLEILTALMPPRPNPFNPKVDLSFVLGDAGSVTLAIYDLHGHLVKSLANRVYSAGEHVLTWSGEDEQSRRVPSGVYIAQLRVASYTQTQRLVLVR